MMNCKVEFIYEEHEDVKLNKKIVVPFTLHEDGSLEYHIITEPKITDPKTDLGLAGQLLEHFLTSLQMPENEPENKPE